MSFLQCCQIKLLLELGLLFTRSSLHQVFSSPGLLFTRSSLHQVFSSPGFLFTRFSLHQVFSSPGLLFTRFSHNHISMKLSNRSCLPIPYPLNEFQSYCPVSYFFKVLSPASVARAALTAVHFLGEFGKNYTTVFFLTDCDDSKANKVLHFDLDSISCVLLPMFSHSFPVSHSFIFFLYFTQNYLLCLVPLTVSSPFHISLCLTLTWHRLLACEGHVSCKMYKNKSMHFLSA